MAIILKTEAVVQRCSTRKAVLKNFTNSLENTCARVSFLIKLQALGNTEHLWATASIKTINNTTVFWDSRL